MERAPSATAAAMMGHTGSAIDTWATTSRSKKVLGRRLVRSMNWCGTTRSPGAISSRSDPTAETESTCVTPKDFRA